jgi:hypothetical protein
MLIGKIIWNVILVAIALCYLVTMPLIYFLFSYLWYEGPAELINSLYKYLIRLENDPSPHIRLFGDLLGLFIVGCFLYLYFGFLYWLIKNYS